MNQMNDYFPWEETPDQDVLEGGRYIMKGVKLEDGTASSGKRMFSAQMQVEQPETYKGMMLFENFVTGTDENPLDIVASSLGTRRMKKNLKAAQVPGSNSVAQMCKSYEGSLFGVTVSKYEEKDGEYKGTLRNRIGAFWKIGERQPGIDTETGGKGPAASAGAGMPPVGAPPMSGQPQVAGAPQQAPQPTPQPAPATTPAPSAPPAAPTHAGPPVGSSAPPVQQVPVGSTPPMQPGGGQVQTVPCGICGQMVEVTQLTEHVQKCAAGQGVS